MSHLLDQLLVIAKVNLNAKVRESVRHKKAKEEIKKWIREKLDREMVRNAKWKQLYVWIENGRILTRKIPD